MSPALRLLADVAERVANAEDEPALLAGTTALLREALVPDGCGFLLLDPDSGLLRHAASFHAAPSRGRPEPIPLGSGAAGEAARTGVARRAASEVCVPLRAGSRVLGVLAAERFGTAPFTEADERLLQIVAVHVAGALDRLRAAAALRESSELYRAYFRGSPVALFVSGSDGRCLEVNGAACALTGFSEAELLRLSIPDLLDGDGDELRAERLLGQLSLGGGQSEIRLRRKDGGVRHCLVHASALGPDRALGLLLDISDRREAEQRLRESEDRFRSLSEASLEALLIHEGGRIVDVNHALCELGGYSWHELVGRDGFDIVAPEYRELAYRNLLAEREAPYEIEVIARDGSRLPVEVQARSFPYRAKVLRVVAVRDLRARRQAAAQRDSLVRELEARNVEIERFAFAVAHELKGPLVTAKGFADHLERDAALGRTDRIVADARRIREAVDRVQQLVDAIDAFSRAARPVGPPAAVAAEDLLREATRLRGSRLEAAGVRVEANDPLPVVYGDRARLVEVFCHVLDDASGTAGGGALVRLEARPPQDGRAVLVVRRSGPGVRAGDYDHLLGLDSGDDAPRLGLSIVRRVVESHGGRAWSEPDAGDVLLCLALPLPPEAGPAREAAARRAE
jgi:PAS domain S-box-containing protein